jgi:pimeloyl-ACP methyl ester carboxylesterase
LDQRGTGRSTPANFHTIGDWGPKKQAGYLQHFRADNIVKDAEYIRNKMIGDKPWSILGQSFGGFCALNYLSFHASGLREALITGGIPPLIAHPDDIYRRTYKRVKQKNFNFFNIFPNAQDRACRIADIIQITSPELPNGDKLTIERFQLLGLQLGFHDGYANLNYLFENAISNEKLSYSFLKGLMGLQSFDTNPFFTILHEACYAQQFSTNWSAERIRGEFPEFDPNSRDPFLFTGEMLYPWMMDQFQTLAPFKEATQLLAEKNDWPSLYDSTALSNIDVPIAAAVYTNDMYVDKDYSLDSAESIKGIQLWETDEFEHNGLRSHGEKVLSNLFELLD